MRATASALALAACWRSPAAADRARAAARRADPAEAVPAGAAVYAGADVRPEGAEQPTRSRRLEADPPGRPLPAPARGAAARRARRPCATSATSRPGSGPHAGIFLTSLAGGDVAAAAARAGPARRPAERRPSPSRTRRPGRDRARHDRRGEGPLVPGRPGQPRRRARGELPRRRATMASAGGVAFGVVASTSPCIGSDRLRARGHRHHARRALAGAFRRTTPAARRGPRGHARPPLHEPCRGSVRRGDVRVCSRCSPADARGEHLARADAGRWRCTSTATSSAATGASGGLLAAAGEGAHALAELPGDSWLAVGLGHLGATLGR